MAIVVREVTDRVAGFWCKTCGWLEYGTVEDGVADNVPVADAADEHLAENTDHTMTVAFLALDNQHVKAV